MKNINMKKIMNNNKNKNFSTKNFPVANTEFIKIFLNFAKTLNFMISDVDRTIINKLVTEFKCNTSSDVERMKLQQMFEHLLLEMDADENSGAAVFKKKIQKVVKERINTYDENSVEHFIYSIILANDKLYYIIYNILTNSISRKLSAYRIMLKISNVILRSGKNKKFGYDVEVKIGAEILQLCINLEIIKKNNDEDCGLIFAEKWCEFVREEQYLKNIADYPLIHYTVDEDNIVKLAYDHIEKYMDNNDVYKSLIVDLSRVKFKVNNDVLTAILSYIVDKNEKVFSHLELTNLVNNEVKKMKTEKMKNTKLYYKNKLNHDEKKKYFNELNKDRVNIDEFESMKNKTISVLYTLLTALIFSNINYFHIAVFADFRGRIYCRNRYFHYQGNSLSRSLLLFYEEDVITLENEYLFFRYGVYLKTGGFSNGKKMSFLEMDTYYTLNMNDFNLPIESDEWIDSDTPLEYLAWKIEYLKYIAHKSSNKSEKFTTGLILRFDATCSGLQHISVLTKNEKLAKLVNLYPSNPSIKPNDLYGYVAEQLCNHIKNFKTNFSPNWENILKIDINRKFIKKAVMTKSYNVSLYSTINYIIEGFNKIQIDNDIKYSRNGINLTYKDIVDISRLVYDISNENNILYPLNEFLEYFKEWSKISAKLNLPIIWKTPSGLVISSSPAEFKFCKVGYLKHSGVKFAVSAVILDDKISARKQTNSLAPNIIHSLDAAHLALFAKSWLKIKRNLIVIHDSFGTSLANVDDMHNLLREEFAKLYRQDFIDYFHNNQIELIKANNYQIVDNCIIIKEKSTKTIKIKLPAKITKHNEFIDDFSRSLYCIY